jgi:3-oxoacyl-[acyl-carrier protein] reductase
MLTLCVLALAVTFHAACGSAEPAVCDIADSKALAEAIDGLAEKHGRLDALVKNAGITRDGLFLRMDDADFDDVINTNLKSAFVATRAAARYIMRAKSGRIVNIGSVSGVIGNAGQANYAASKAGLIVLSKSVARELAGKGVTCNVIAPGFIATDMAVASGADFDAIAAKAMMRRVGTPDDIAAAASFLASEEAGFITAQLLTVDGGRTSSL